MSEVDYPADSLQGGKRTIKWIRSLPKSEIHKVIIDKNLPESIMEDLCRELPFQYLQNLACNRKVPSRVRVMILRRAFRAQESDFKYDKKLQLFSVILGLSFVSKKEKQVAKSYIQEIQGPNIPGKRKRRKEARSNSEAKSPNRVQTYFSNFQTKDSTKEEIFAVLIDLAFASQSAEYKFDRLLLQERVNVFWPVFMKESGNKSILIDPRLIVLQIQLSSGTLPIQSKLRIETLQETLRNKVRGSHRDELIANCLDQGNVNQTLHEMLIWILDVGFLNLKLSLIKLFLVFDVRCEFAKGCHGRVDVAVHHGPLHAEVFGDELGRLVLEFDPLKDFELPQRDTVP